MIWMFLSKGPSKYSNNLLVTTKNFLFGIKSSSLWLRQKKPLSLSWEITVADQVNHCRWFFMKISLSEAWKSLPRINGFCYKPWTRNVTDFPRANARTHSPYTLQSLRVYQYRSRVRPTVENVAHPWFLVIRFEHECVCDSHPLPSDSSGMHPFMFKLVMSSRSKS